MVFSLRTLRGCFNLYLVERANIMSVSGVGARDARQPARCLQAAGPANRARNLTEPYPDVCTHFSLIAQLQRGDYCDSSSGKIEPCALVSGMRVTMQVRVGMHAAGVMVAKSIQMKRILLFVCVYI